MENKVSVLVLGYKDIKNVDECLLSLLNQDYKNFDVWFADNNSGDGSTEYIKKEFLGVKAIQFKDNTGYAGGNNKLLEMAFKNGADFCLVLNPDVKVSTNLISSLIRTYKNESLKNKIGLVQPLVMLYDDPKMVNSYGNAIHYLGFGYCGGYRSSNVPKNDKEIISVSGTAMLISREYFEEIGSFDDSFFMYNEDQDYSWRGILKGYKHYLSVNGQVWHKYSFIKNEKKMFYSEKNRLIMILKNYEFIILIKIIPILFLNEILVMIYALFDGWFLLKMKSYWIIIKNWEKISNKRDKIQKSRLVRDKEYIEKFISRLSFSEINNVGIKYLVNPIYSFYKKIIL